VDWTTIVSPRELHERLGDPAIVIFDCRHSLADHSLGRRLYDESHVPGAFFADAETDLAGPKTGTNGRHPLPDPERFARFLRDAGVDDATQIVAYDEGGDLFATRLWFLARWIGHDRVAVLDGGLDAWLRLGYSVTSDAPAPREGTLTIALRPELVVDAAYVLEHLESPAMQLLDARSKERFLGENESVDPQGGHIPGARSRWFAANYNADGTFKSPQALREEFARAGLDPKRTVHQCGSGLSASVGLFAMEHAGLTGSRLYNGSWSEWIADPTRPIAKGE